MKRKILGSLIFVVISFYTLQLTAFPSDSTTVLVNVPPKTHWYDKISLRGYTQIRYNRLLETNPDLKCEQCDKSWGKGGGFFIRRARLIFSGDVHPRVYIYIQTDLASAVSSSLNFVQLRDAYFDLALDAKKEFRFRVGQSKVPYGFENLQSSQNRLPLDRADALNSAVANERDLGVFFYWAPVNIRKRFSSLITRGLKGSGDYGVFGIGIYNGQTANKPELNDNPHVVARLTYPFLLKSGQVIEAGIQGYTGKYQLAKDQVTANTTSLEQYKDKRVAATFVVYPQPLGFETEYNIGKGPEYNPENNTIEAKNLEGGYLQAMYKINISKEHFLIPFFRTQYYKGGKKHETDARKYIVYEHEIGIEWQPITNFEMVAMYTISDRTFEDGNKPVNRQKGNLLRLQLQINY